MSKNMKCPYCNADIDINHVYDGYGYEEDKIHQQECPVCDKSFVYTTSSFAYSAKKAPCLNGGDHDYQLTKTFPPERAWLQCTICDDRK